MSVGTIKNLIIKLRDLHDLNTPSCGGLEHLKIETRLKDERFASAMGECVI
jgi:hypothetical protein